MSSYLQEPQAGDPPSASWAADVVRAIRANQITSVVGGTFERSPGGTSLVVGSSDADTVNTFHMTGTAIPAKITGGSSMLGYTVDLYHLGREHPPTATGTVFATDVAADSVIDLPEGTFILAHPFETTVTGGS